MHTETLNNRLTDWALARRSIHLERVRALAQASNSVLDVGTGAGLNSGAYPEQVRAVTSVTLNLEDRLDERVRRRAGAREIVVTHVSGDAERLPFRGASFDTIVSTFLHCSVSDPAAAVREFARLARPGGNRLFLEHVVSNDAHTRSRRRLVDPIYNNKTSGGCSLTCDTQSTIVEYGFAIEELAQHDLRGTLWIARCVIRGRATTGPAARAAQIGLVEASRA